LAEDEGLKAAGGYDFRGVGVSDEVAVTYDVGSRRELAMQPSSAVLNTSTACDIRVYLYFFCYCKPELLLNANVLDRHIDSCSLFITYAVLSKREKVYLRSQQTRVQMRC
jgi:hypothetical protein